MNNRREFLLGAAATATAQTARPYDVAIVGAGVFGAWTAWHLHRAGRKIILIDAYGAASARASSGGESRVIRMAYGPDEIYTRFSRRSLDLWKELFARTGDPLFHQTGVLWLARRNDAGALRSVEVMRNLGIAHERLSQADLARRFPQIAIHDVDWGIYEPGSGALLARRSVHRVVGELTPAGVELVLDPVAPPTPARRLDSVRTRGGREIRAASFVFACGPWLAKVFPGALGNRIFPTRQEVYFFGPTAGDRRFAPPAMPCWIDVDNLYGIPDLENRGFKIADDSHGPAIDPDSADRAVPQERIDAMRRRLGARFPALKSAPLLETRVCQYENSSNGDFLLDRHPEIENVWLAGGGSGHGFKHGPAVGEYLAARILGRGAAEPRFSFASKGTVQKRTVH